MSRRLGPRIVALLLATGTLLVMDGAVAGPKSLARRLRDRDPEVRIEAVREVRAEPTFADVKRAFPLLDDEHPYVRDLVWATLSEIRDPVWLAWTAEAAAAQRSTRLRRGAVEALARGGAPEAFAALRPFADDDDAGVREALAAGLPRFRDRPEARSVARALISDEDPRVRAAALDALSRIDPSAAVADLRASGLTDEDAGVRCTALRSLRYGDRDAAVKAAAERLREGTWRERRQAIENARWLRARAGVPGLIEALDHVERPAVRAELFDALVALTGLDHPPVAADWKTWWEAHGEEWLKGGTRAPPPKERAYVGPTYHRIPVVSRRVVFVCDASGSMARRVSKEDPRVKLDVVKEELLAVLDAAEEGFRFNVIFLQDEPHLFREQVVKLDRRSRSDLESFFRKFRAKGKTNVYDALARALADDDADTIYFLSDGAPSAGAYLFKSRVLAHVRRINRRRKIVIHSVSLAGKDVDQQLMRDLAKQNGGTSVDTWRR